VCRDLLPDPIFLESDDDKVKRRAIHDFFKKPVFEQLITETLIRKAPANGQPGESVIKISYLPPVTPPPSITILISKQEVFLNGPKNAGQVNHKP
jgi:hypothetical protein